MSSIGNVSERSTGSWVSVSVFWLVQVSALLVFFVPFGWHLVGLGHEDVQEAYGPMVGIPVTVVIGRDGNICTRYFGLRSKDRFEADIKALL